MRRPLARTIGLALFFAPAAALPFAAVDTIAWPSSGRFPAYPPEEIRPYEVFVEGGLMHDTNILRRNAGAARENVFRFGAGGRYEQRIVGRQRVRLEARGDQYRFDRFSNLNHFAYAANATSLWELGNDLAGTLGYSRAQRLVDLSQVQRAVRRMVTTDDIFGSAAYRLGPNTRLRTLGLYSRGVRATPGEDRVTFGARSITFGADYVTPLGNALGVEHRQTRGDAPVSRTIDVSGEFINNDYRERETALVATYTSSATLRFTGRLGRTKRAYTDLTTGFEGTTYRAGVEWLPGVKTILAFEVYREPRAIIDLAASHVVIRGIAFGPTWAPTAKLSFTGRLINERRAFVAADNTIAPAGTLLDETVRGVRLGIGWEPQRLVQVGLGLDRGNRESNTLGRNYNYTATSINARVIW